MNIAFYGSSILSSYWNGAATYYRGLIRALAALGHRVTFLEPNAFGRQERRDIEPPDWCDVVVYPASDEGVARASCWARMADVVVKASGVGTHDDALLEMTMAAARPDAIRIWWDVDAPATLASLRTDPKAALHRLLPALDSVIVYGGGQEVCGEYVAFGARRCFPIYNGIDPETHFPAPTDRRFEADLGFLGNRLPDREARVEEFLFVPARQAPERRFLLSGAGWDDAVLPANVRHLGHVGTGDHNAFNSTPRAILNVNRESMARRGYSPPTRVFEAAAAGACVITDAWEGIAAFFAPGKEILVARDGQDVLDLLAGLTGTGAREIGRRARDRVLADHTYARRAREVDALFRRLLTDRQKVLAA
jgi:spore maturation protein CgeB